MEKRLRVLISAYACEPGLGSEEGIGWNTILHLSQHVDVWAITQAANREKIEAASGIPSNIHWVYYDLPRWATFYRKGKRGTRLHYNLWQRGVYPLARRLHDELHFDLIHHVTYGQYWTPSYLSRLSAPFMWGPVGGGESAPRSFYSTLGRKGWLFEVVRDVARRLGELHPTVRYTARHARLVLATSPETAARIQRLWRRDVETVTNVALGADEYDQLSQIPIHDLTPFRMVSIGRMLAWKGFHLGLAAFARLTQDFPAAEYWFIGDGPEEARLKALAAELGVPDKVRFLGQIPRDEVLARIAECDVLVHPSLHDSGGWVCLEAMAAARPVICLDLGGPATLVSDGAGFKIPAHSPDEAISGMAQAMLLLAGDPAYRAHMAHNARQHVRSKHLWDQRAAELFSYYRVALRLPGYVGQAEWLPGLDTPAISHHVGVGVKNGGQG
ncbi:MAG: glycosyltransferase family 4 protein [Anaerolineae bacterium]|nr:glycosyltransferase family 4 protein [Anaerolineae bacterium]